MKDNIIVLKKKKNMKSTEQSEQSNTEQYVEEQIKQNSSEELMNRYRILTTPFDAITTKSENGQENYFIAWGRHRISQLLSKEQQEAKIKRLEEGYADWDIIGSMVGIINTIMNEEK